MSDHGTIQIGAHRLRQWEQQAIDARGTFIVQETRVTVIPAWKLDRERRAAARTTERPNKVVNIR